MSTIVRGRERPMVSRLPACHDPKRLKTAALLKTLCSCGLQKGAPYCARCGLCAYGREWSSRILEGGGVQ